MPDLDTVEDRSAAIQLHLDELPRPASWTLTVRLAQQTLPAAGRATNHAVVTTWGYIVLAEVHVLASRFDRRHSTVQAYQGVVEAAEGNKVAGDTEFWHQVGQGVLVGLAHHLAGQLVGLAHHLAGQL